MVSIKELGRPTNDGSSKKPDWNAALTKVPLNQGADFQREILARQERNDKELLDYIRDRYERLKGPRK